MVFQAKTKGSSNTLQTFLLLRSLDHLSSVVESTMSEQAVNSWSNFVSIDIVQDRACCRQQRVCFAFMDPGGAHSEQ